MHRSVSGLKKMRASDGSKKVKVEKVDVVDSVVENVSAKKHQNPKNIPAAKVLPKITCKPEANICNRISYAYENPLLFCFWLFGFGSNTARACGMLGQAQIDSLLSKADAFGQ